MITALVVGMAVLSAPKADIPLKVMTFNLRSGTIDDQGNSWKYRKDFLVDMLKQYQPDLIGTQECRDFQENYIIEHLDGYASIGVGRNQDGRGERASIIYNQAVLMPVESGDFWLSETPDVPGSKGWDAAITRIVTWVRFYHPKTGRFFYYLNTHFDHKGEFARAASAELMVQRAKAMAGALPYIITGDFNATAEHSKPYEIFTESGLKDAWLTANKHVGPEYTYNAFEPLKKGRIDRIDWILTYGNIAVDRCETITYNKNGHWPSDHFPVMATITIKDSAQ